MNRYLAFALMLATAVAMAQDKPKAKHSAASVATQKKTEAAPVPKETPKAETEVAQAQSDKNKPQTGEDGKLTSVPGSKALGMSILGNQDAPKSLVIVPWKTSELGDSPGISPMLDDSRQPVDKEVFMRSLRYYEIRSGKQ